SAEAPNVNREFRRVPIRHSYATERGQPTTRQSHVSEPLLSKTLYQAWPAASAISSPKPGEKHASILPSSPGGNSSRVHLRRIAAFSSAWKSNADRQSVQPSRWAWM